MNLQPMLEHLGGNILAFKICIPILAAVGCVALSRERTSAAARQFVRCLGMFAILLAGCSPSSSHHVSAPEDAAGQTPVLQIRSVKEKPGSDTEPMLHSVNTSDGRTLELTRHVAKPMLLDERAIKAFELRMYPGSDKPSLVIHLNDDGATRFAEMTRSHTGQQIAIILDGEILSAPVVRETIPSGSFSITCENEHHCRNILSRLQEAQSGLLHLARATVTVGDPREPLNAKALQQEKQLLLDVAQQYLRQDERMEIQESNRTRAKRFLTQRGRQTSVRDRFTLQIMSPDPERATALANKIAQEYSAKETGN